MLEAVGALVLCLSSNMISTSSAWVYVGVGWGWGEYKARTSVVHHNHTDPS